MDEGRIDKIDCSKSKVKSNERRQGCTVGPQTLSEAKEHACDNIAAATQTEKGK
jgi:hypothetical protein